MMASALRTSSLARGACLLLLAAGARVAEAGNSFLGTVSRAEVQMQLLSEIRSMLGHGASHARLERFEESMQPTYSTLPKNETGYIDHGAARYALHRYFLSRHGWHIRGLAPDGARWNASNSTSMLKSRVPDFILDMFTTRPLGLKALAILAATVEDLVHSDTVELLRMAYQTHGFPVAEPLASVEQEELVIKTYLLFFILPWSQQELDTTAAILDFFPEASQAYPGWDDTVMWVEDLKGALRYQERSEYNPFLTDGMHFRSFSSLARLMAQVIDGVGMFQNIECKMIKNKLMDLQGDDRSDGRIPLGKFYQDFLAEREYWFTESPEYLRNLGALDDSDPSSLSVIVPNLLYGRSNCLAISSGFHSLCCVNQCDSLMESIEIGIARPAAKPDALIQFVSSLSSDTIAAPRNLSRSLRHKLDRIAEQHKGYVPLHGRLFAQWMHHAFPNECPLPQRSGAAVPLTHDEWSEHYQNESVASVEVMQRFVNEANLTANASTSSVFDEAALLWTDDEELVTDVEFEEWGAEGGGQHRLLGLLRVVAMFIAIAATFGVVFDSVRSLASFICRVALKGSPRSNWTRWLDPAGKRRVEHSEWI